MNNFPKSIFVTNKMEEQEQRSSNRLFPDSHSRWWCQKEWGSRSWRSLGVVLTSHPCKALWQPQGEPSDLWEPHGGLWDPYMHPWEQHGGPGNLAYPREPHWWTAKEASHEMHTLATGYNSDWVQLAGTTGNSLQKPFYTFCNTIISFSHLIQPTTDWTKTVPLYAFSPFPICHWREAD